MVDVTFFIDVNFGDFLKAWYLKGLSWNRLDTVDKVWFIEGIVHAPVAVGLQPKMFPKGLVYHVWHRLASVQMASRMYLCDINDLNLNH